MHNIPSKLYGNNSYKIFFDCRVNLMNDLSQTKSLCKQANGTTANCMDQHEAYAGSVVSNIDYRSMFRHLITFCYQRACSSWIYLLMYLKSQRCLYYTSQSKSYQLFNTQSRVLQADWLILENNEKATLNLYMPY